MYLALVVLLAIGYIFMVLPWAVCLSAVVWLLWKYAIVVLFSTNMISVWLCLVIGFVLAIFIPNKYTININIKRND